MEVNIGHDVHAGPKLTIAIFSRIENDFYRNPLNNFHVIASGVFRWKQTEEWARCSRNAVHVSFQSPASGIDVNFRFLTHTHVLKLRLFEIGGDPHFVERHDREQLLAGLHIQPDDNCLVHFTRDRRDNFGVSEV